MVGTLARNYGRALFEVCEESRDVDEVGATLEAAAGVLWGDIDTRRFLSSKVVGRHQKKAVIRAGLGKGADERLLSLLSLLVDRGRMRLLGDISEEFQRLARYARGERRVSVHSAFPLGDEERGRLAAALAGRLGGRVILDVTLDASLIAGVVCLSEGQEIEYTAGGQLKALAGRLSGHDGGKGRDGHAH